VTGVTSEVLKNLVLAGIRATVCDSRPFPSAMADGTPCFLLPPSSEPPSSKKAKLETVGQALKPVVENLNLLLGDCEIIDKAVSELDADLLKDYPIVVASRIAPSEALRLAQLVTEAGNKFFLADTFGMYGGSLMDLGEHTYRPEMGKKLLDPKPLLPKVSLQEAWDTPFTKSLQKFKKKYRQHPPVEWMRYRLILQYFHETNRWPTADDTDDFCQRSLAWIQTTAAELPPHDILTEDALKTLATNASAGELAPVCAVLGGLLGNEVIKAISGKGEPANNTLFFDMETCEAMAFLVHPKANPHDDAEQASSS
jgi:ubiquitin-like 1-activating enzyme E1 A